MARQAVSAEQLHAMLVREYAQSRVVDCVTRCHMPQPVFREANGLDVANWVVRPALTCPRHCHRLIADIAARVAASYDMETPLRVAS